MIIERIDTALASTLPDDSASGRDILGQDVLGRIAAGEVIVVRGLLQTIGWHNRLRDLCLDVLVDLVGQERADAVLSAHFTRIHEQLPMAMLVAFNGRAMARLRPLAPAIIKDFARIVLGSTGVYAETHPNLRTIPPHDIAVGHHDLLAEDECRRGAGKLTLHPPHHDSWHGHPLSTINLWCALSPVTDGNGMVFFPEVWGESLPTGPDGNLRRDQILGHALGLSLEPGDGVLFHANHLHGSELNRAAQTRCVVSLRMTPQAPDFPHAQVFRYLYAGWIGTPLERWARLPVMLSRNYVTRRWTSLIDRIARRPPIARGLRAEHRFPATHDRSGNAPPPATAYWNDAHRIVRIPTDALPERSITSVDERFCVAHAPSGYALFPRTCPHEGADLAGGTVREDGRITCPWHNLVFDPATGNSPCSAITPLQVVPGRIADGWVTFDLDAAALPRKADR